jgi:hypothetical protein
MGRPKRVLEVIAALTPVLIAAAVLLAGATPAPAGARGAPSHWAIPVPKPSPGSERFTFKPRIGHAMGLMPRLGIPELVSGRNEPVVYHGGDVMRNVTLHTIFWAPPGHHFDGPPSPGTLGYEALVKQFLVDVTHDANDPAENVFSTLVQYGDGHGPGTTQITYDPATDSTDLSAPYPALKRQCASPASIATCITDLQLEQQVDRVIGPDDRRGRGLRNIWFILLPPDVDTCLQPGQCATTVFAGYHSEFDLGHGPTVYVPIPDPLVEFTPPPGSDPEGNPEAESTIDTMAHETEEAITDPYGTGWMDPNGLEVADKCESGGEQGTPLGFAPDASPYNQLIDGHEYLFQDMWSNAASGCVQSSKSTRSALPLRTVSLHQFSPFVSGDLGVDKRTSVAVGLIRAGDLVATAHTQTRANGAWGPVKLRSRRGAPHAVGDDREGVVVIYENSLASADLIATGDGGNPFTESGYTGWFDLDHGFAVGPDAVVLGPCGQTGVLTLRVGSKLTQPPAQLCSNEAGAALVPTPAIGPGTRVTMSSEDNRADSALLPNGALVKLSVSLGEPRSLPTELNRRLPFLPTGMPQCTALLRVESVRCTGLVPGTRYRLGRHRAGAGIHGTITVTGLHLRGGQALTLVNSAGRQLTTLHVAHLRVHITGDQTEVASGRCQPGDFYGPPLTKPPVSDQVGDGVLGDGIVCPANGSARGLPTGDIAQTDDFSGGQTVVTVPLIRSTAPIEDETLFGPFIGSAQTGLPGPHGSIGATGVPVALTITRAASRRTVFHATNVDRARGVDVPPLTPGQYLAHWLLHDANGDTRSETTRFVDEP